MTKNINTSTQPRGIRVRKERYVHRRIVNGKQCIKYDDNLDVVNDYKNRLHEQSSNTYDTRSSKIEDELLNVIVNATDHTVINDTIKAAAVRLGVIDTPTVSIARSPDGGISVKNFFYDWVLRVNKHDSDRLREGQVWG